jgi:hypothetical protein
MKTLHELIDHLERAIERAEEPGWNVLTLNAGQAEALLDNLRAKELLANEYVNAMDRSNYSAE